MNTVLITGATGLLGSYLGPFLRRKGYSVLTQGRHGGVDFMVDLLDSDRVLDMLLAVKLSMIVNLVGLTNVDRCEESPNDAYLNNVRTTENLVDCIGSLPYDCHLVHISTDQVYDGPGPHDERATIIKNMYAMSKYAGELAAASISSTVVRTNFMGCSKVPGRSSLTDWLFSALTEKRPIQVFDDVYFSPLSIATLVEMVERIIEIKPLGIFNVGSREGMSKADFAFRFATSMGLDKSNLTRSESTQAGFLCAYRPKDMRMDCSKFEKSVGVKMPKLMDEIVKVCKGYHELI